MKKIIMFFFCFAFIQSSFGEVKVKSLGTLNPAGRTTFNSRYTSIKQQPVKTVDTTTTNTTKVNVNPIVMKSTVNKIGNTFKSIPNSNYTIAKTVIDTMNSIVNDLNARMVNIQDELDAKPNKEDIYTKEYLTEKYNELKTEITNAEGSKGLSAYQIAVNNGFVGTEAEWLASLKGEKGDSSKSDIVGCSNDGSYLLDVNNGTKNCKQIQLTNDNFVE